MNYNDIFQTQTMNVTFIDKFRMAVNLYELCKKERSNLRALNHLLKEKCQDQSSLYQNDSARHHRRNFLYNIATPLSYKVLRFVYAEDEEYFKNFYKGKKEADLATSLELLAKVIEI
jgi:hypothetical protein